MYHRMGDMLRKQQTARHYSMETEKNVKPDIANELIVLMPRIWRFALSQSGRPDIADDLLQATCLRALERAHQFRGTGTLIAWLLTICRSIWLNELRSVSVRKTGGMETAGEADLVDIRPSAEINIFAREVFAKVMELPEAQRVTVELVYLQQFTYAEAAIILEVPIGTVMSRLFAARRSLAELNETGLEKVKESRR